MKCGELKDNNELVEVNSNYNELLAILEKGNFTKEQIISIFDSKICEAMFDDEDLAKGNILVKYRARIKNSRNYVRVLKNIIKEMSQLM